MSVTYDCDSIWVSRRALGQHSSPTFPHMKVSGCSVVIREAVTHQCDHGWLGVPSKVLLIQSVISIIILLPSLSELCSLWHRPWYFQLQRLFPRWHLRSFSAASGAVKVLNPSPGASLAFPGCPSALLALLGHVSPLLCSENVTSETLR